MKYLYPLSITLVSITAIGVYFISTQASATITYTKSSTVTIAEKEFLNTTPTTSPSTNIDEIIEPLLVETESDDSILEVEDKVEAEDIDNKKRVSSTEGVPLTVPFYSQFTDITLVNWKKIGCGIASLAMIIDYYKTNPPSVDTLLQEGIDTDAYLNDAGWTYAGLIGVSKKYGFTGQSHDLASATMESAFNSLKTALANGPVMVSVHYKFEPTNPIPHLVIANGIHNEMIYYNDPAAETGNLSISVRAFKEAWKKRYIEIRPIS